MKKETVIKITLADDSIILNGENLQDLTENDIIDSLQVLVSLAKVRFGWKEGDTADGNA